MSDVPVELVVAAFTDEQGAEKALEALKRAKKDKLIHIQDAAIITCDLNNKVHIKETGDMRGGKGAGIGALVGGAVGLIFPPSILASAAVGAAVGGLGAKMHDAGFRDERLKELGASLKPGTSAIVAVIEHIWVEELERELAAQGAQLVRQAIKEDIAKQLDAGQGVAYAALLTDDAVVVDREVEPPTTTTTTETTTPPA